MKIKLKLKQMFALSQIVEKQTIIGYRAALTKLFHKMLDNEDFSKIISLFEEIKINEKNILSEVEEERNEIAQELQSNQNKISDELQEKINSVNLKINQKIQELNGEPLNSINNLLNKNDVEFEVEFNDLLKKSISSIVESEKSASELELDDQIVKSLIDIYVNFSED